MELMFIEQEALMPFHVFVRRYRKPENFSPRQQIPGRPPID